MKENYKTIDHGSCGLPRANAERFWKGSAANNRTPETRQRAQLSDTPEQALTVLEEKEDETI